MKKLARLPGRISDDLRIIAMARNWSEILTAKARQTPLGAIRLRNGVVLESPPQVDLNFLFHEIWIDEFYAPKGYEIIGGDTVVDIGANIGVFATWAATKKPNVRVISFEPFPSNAAIFEKNIAASRLGNVEFHPVAVGAGNEKRTLNVSDSWILHSLSDNEQSENGISIDCVGLDSAMENVEKCDLLKLDCEGGEYEILYSASAGTISKIKRVVCEYNLLDDEKRNGKGLSDFLTANGFLVGEHRQLDHTSGFICAKRA
ncbi:MAG TPA: FkbM family methyltransferase [Pyrinomonadaceae bacterium]|nr:FkbM family methyltransferase [Pyrinomonadaceae bacterium]